MLPAGPERDRLLQKSRSELEAFLRSNPSPGLASEAMQALGNTIVEQARGLAIASERAGIAGSKQIAEQARLTMFNPQYGIGPDLIIAIVVAIVLALIFDRTAWGLKVRQLGEMNDFAEYTGVSAKRMSMQVMAVSGAVAGFAGALFVIGPTGGRFLQQFSPGFGFMAITVALLARLNPWASLVAALFYATMIGGSTGLQAVGVPFPLVSVLQGLIIVMITATFTWNWLKRRKSGGAATTPATEGASK